MKYYTGLYALTQYADTSENSVGLYIDADEVIRSRDEYIKDSNETLLKDFGIFDTYTVPKGEQIKCASHTRAYIDMLCDHKFDDLKGIAETAIKDLNTIHNIFSNSKKFGLFDDDEILKFLNDEFKSTFRSYLMTVGDDDHLYKIIGEAIW